jgi:nucleoid-associated protein YgaU
MNGKSDQDSINVSGTVGEKGTEGTPVNKVDGDVYPTEAPTQQVNDPSEPSDETEAAAPVSSTYTVQKGDTLLSICRRTYGDTQKLEEVMIVNSLDDPNKIYIGQEIKLP